MKIEGYDVICFGTTRKDRKLKKDCRDCPLYCRSNVNPEKPTWRGKGFMEANKRKCKIKELALQQHGKRKE